MKKEDLTTPDGWVIDFDKAISDKKRIFLKFKDRLIELKSLPWPGANSMDSVIECIRYDK